MRVSDAEREAAVAELQEHFTSGRLNQEELDERLAAAFAAKTRGDLNAVFTDLPLSGRDWAGAGAAGGRASGPFGPGPFGPGPFGAGGPGARPGWQAGGNACGRPSAGRSIRRVVFAALMLWLLFAVGILGVFGIGAGRPAGIVLIVAAFALLRRLFMMIFGRRRMRGCGPRRGPRRRRF
ncbi:MAG TPA: DUF1707 domain-containing protein [Trebonia sp.]|nr:DUF1707 domain-containing protein [Trebonia sp.]